MKLQISQRTLDLINEHTETFCIIDSINSVTGKYIIEIEDDLYEELSKRAATQDKTIEEIIVQLVL